MQVVRLHGLWFLASTIPGLNLLHDVELVDFLGSAFTVALSLDNSKCFECDLLSFLKRTGFSALTSDAGCAG